jgi:hypothetical protein
MGQMDGMLEAQQGSGEDDSGSARKVSRLELNAKKDSGYGSQGLIAVQQVNTTDTASKYCKVNTSIYSNSLQQVNTLQ